MSEPIVTLEHCRRLGYCAKGMRAFFAERGMDWQTFMECGLPAEVIEATGDDMAIQAAALARNETRD